MHMNKPEKKGLVPSLRFPEFKDAGEWDIKKLSELLFEAKQRNRKMKYGPKEVLSVSGEHGCVNQIELLGRSYAGVSVENYHVVETGDIVYTKSPLKKNPFGIIRENKGKPGIVSTLYAVYRVTDKAHPAYLDHYFSRDFNLNSYLQPIVNKGAKNDMKVKNSYVLSGEIPAPKIEEQKRIADCITSVDDLITAQTKKLDALKTHKKGLMQQLFPAEGKTVPKLRFPEFRGSAVWECKPMAKVCNVLQGYGFPEVLQGQNKGNYPFCKVSDISRAVAENGGLLDEATNYVGDDDLLKLKAKLIPKGATVFAKIGEALRLNRRAYVRKECLIDNNATGLKAIEGEADDYFVYLMSQLIDLNKHCGGAVPSVNKSTLEEIEVVVPDPDEQKRIADSLKSLDNLITAQIQKLDALKAHKKGLLQQLFPARELSNI